MKLYLTSTRLPGHMISRLSDTVIDEETGCMIIARPMKKKDTRDSA